MTNNSKNKNSKENNRPRKKRNNNSSLADYKPILIISLCVLIGFAIVFGIYKLVGNNKGEDVDTNKLPKVEDSTDYGDVGADDEEDEMGDYYLSDEDFTYAGDNEFVEVPKPEGEELEVTDTDFAEIHWDKVSSGKTVLEKNEAYDEFLKAFTKELNLGRVPSIVDENLLEYKDNNSKGISSFKQKVGNNNVEIFNVVVPSSSASPNSNSSIIMYLNSADIKTNNIFHKSNALLETVTSYGDILVMSGRYIRPDMDTSKAQYWTKAMRVDSVGSTFLDVAENNDSGQIISVSGNDRVLNIVSSDGTTYLTPEKVDGGIRYVSGDGIESVFIDVSNGQIKTSILNKGEEPVNEYAPQETDRPEINDMDIIPELDNVVIPNINTP